MSTSSSGDAAAVRGHDHYLELSRRYEEVATRMLEADRESGELVKLYVTLRRLYEAPDRASVIASVSEIIVSMIGCEEFAILEEDGSGETFAVVDSMGVDAADYDAMAIGTHPIGRLASAGQVHVTQAGESGAGAAPEPLAVIPLCFGVRVAGAIVLVRLLEHRDPLDGNDLALLQLLALHTVPAARLAALRAESERRPGAAD